MDVKKRKQDAEPEPIWDQRMVYFGTTLGISADDIEGAWERHRAMLVQNGYRIFPGRPGVNENLDWIEGEESLVAQVIGNRWATRCPHCNDGIALWQENPQAACLTCGRVYSNIQWPSPKEMEVAVAALLKRPDLGTRFWNPAEQSVKELHAENAEHAEEVGD